MCQWIGSALVQIMACCLFVPKPLSKPMLDDLSIGLLGTNSVKFWSKYKSLHSSLKMHLKMSAENWRHFYLGLNLLIMAYFQMLWILYTYENNLGYHPVGYAQTPSSFRPSALSDYWWFWKRLGLWNGRWLLPLQKSFHRVLLHLNLLLYIWWPVLSKRTPT